MQVKNALTDQAQKMVDFLQGQIRTIEAFNANLESIPETWMFNREAARKENNRVIETYRDEIIELEELRDGYITVKQLGTARRFFNTMPAWATYGT